jgi:hypothetical protein
MAIALATHYFTVIPSPPHLNPVVDPSAQPVKPEEATPERSTAPPLTSEKRSPKASPGSDEDGFERPDSQAEAAAFRRLQLQDEYGYVETDGLMSALAPAGALRASEDLLVQVPSFHRRTDS